jgi:subtilisin-like proprotein convertase family protein
MRLAVYWLIFGLLTGLAGRAQVFQKTVLTDIPDGNPTGLGSTIQVGGLASQLQNITVSLDISGGFNGDLYAYLSHGSSGFAVLLNRVGKTGSDPFGYADAGFSITLSDAASQDIHGYGGNGGLAFSGNLQPDGRNANPQLVLDSSPRSAMLSSFIGSDPNGPWVLFVADMAGGGGQATLQDWSIAITAVPEPGIGTLFIAMTGCLLLAGKRLNRRWRTVRS